MKLKDLFEGMDRRSFLRGAVGAAAGAALAMVPSKVTARTKYVFLSTDTEGSEWYLVADDILLISGIYQFFLKVTSDPDTKHETSTLIHYLYNPKSNEVAAIYAYALGQDGRPDARMPTFTGGVNFYSLEDATFRHMRKLPQLLKIYFQKS